MTPAFGYSISQQNHFVLDDSAINAAEITFDRPDDPLRVGRYVSECCFDRISVHAAKLSVASPEDPNRKSLEALREIAYQNNADSISDHLGILRSSPSRNADTWHLPPQWTTAVLTQTCRKIESIQHFFRDRRFYVETIAYLSQPEGSMSEAEFLGQVLRSTGCGWLLDVTSIYANAANTGFDPFDFLATVLADADRVQVHLSGGYTDLQTGLFVKSSSHPIPEAVWDLFRMALEQAEGKIGAVFLERDQDGLDEDCWRSEVRRVRLLAENPEALEVPVGAGV